MEFLGSGGVILALIAIAWLSFMTPSGQRSVKVERKSRVRQVKIQKSTQISVKNTDQAESLANKGQEDQQKPEITVEKVVINRLPDPLSARLGSIENVSWAPVVDLEKKREEKENINSETLDEILKRRRSIG